MKIKIYVTIAILSAALLISCDTRNLGLFTSFDDIGSPAIPGTVKYDKSDKVYTLSGSGENIWFNKDSFSFLSRKANKNFTFSGSFRFIGYADHHRKIGLMIRSNKEPDAVMLCCTLHGDGLTSFQFRKKAGDNVEEDKCNMSYGNTVEMIKEGNIYTLTVRDASGKIDTETYETDFGPDATVGLFICSHDDKKEESCEYYDVKFVNNK